MRRAVVLALAATVTTAHASPWTVTVEGGAEVDTNVQRVETGPMLETAPISAPVMRLGGRLIRRDRAFGGGYGLSLSTLARIVGDESAAIESTVLLALDARYLHAIAERPLSLGAALTGADAIPVADDVGTRAFRNLGADALLALRDPEDDNRALTLAVGGRLFEYKPDPAFDWVGPTASLRLDVTLWQPPDETRSLELAGIVGVDLRSYGSKAFADACPLDAEPAPMCFAPTTIDRHDRYLRAGAELTYTGAIVAALGYQLVAIDSNSYGQSIIRHRIQASGTIGLGAKVYATLLGVLQFEQYTDGLVVQTRPDRLIFTSLDDENRSNLSVRFGRPMSGAWSIEARVAYWRNLGASQNDFERVLVYAGAIYSR